MNNRIVAAYQDLGFEETMLSLNLAIVRKSDGRSLLEVNNEHGVRKCVTLLENLIGIFENLIYVSPSRIEFENSPSNERKFRMSTLILRIINKMFPKFDHDLKPARMPVDIDNMWDRFIDPLALLLTYKVIVLKEWLQDLIFNEFSMREDFNVIAIGCRDRIMSPDLPHHPHYGSFSNELKGSFEHIKSSLDRGNYQCRQCRTPLNVSNIAIWAECKHISLCAKCAFVRFSTKLAHHSVKRRRDGSISSLLDVVQKKDCPQCHVPIAVWSKGKYMIDAENHVYGFLDVKPDRAAILQQEIESLRRIICSSMKHNQNGSNNLMMLLNETAYHFDIKYYKKPEIRTMASYLQPFQY